MRNILARTQQHYSQSSAICVSHQFDHILRVLDHAQKAVEVEDSFSQIDSFREIRCCLSAAILHDVDDSKFADKSLEPDYNAKLIMNDCQVSPVDQDLILEMISYVSTASNHNSIPERALTRPWLLIPRHADRLDAVGLQGVIRCWQYTKTVNNPLFTPQTPKPETLDALWEIATVERFEAYQGKSASMIDHYYDKLLRLANFKTSNSYLVSAQSDGLSALEAVIREFIADTLTDQYFESRLI